MGLSRRQIFTADSRFAVVPKSDGKPMTLTGYPLVWNVLSTDRGGYVVRLMPGSATFATPTMALLNHSFGNIIGNTENGTLRLKPDDYGVKCEIDLPDTTMGRDTAELVAAKYIKGMSFSMVTTPDGESVTENGKTIFNASSFLVDEVTITGIPSFQDASIDVKQPGQKFAARERQSLQLEKFKFNMLTLAPEAQKRIVR